jgi:hypothetical protein
MLIYAKNSMAQGGNLQVVHSAAIERLVEQHVEYNRTRPITGYRIRIFRDNNATARQQAYAAKERFSNLYPDISTDLNYDTPYFKVTAGDFRTRDDALALFNKMKRHFPKAFIVMEDIRLPPLHANEYEE